MKIAINYQLELETEIESKIKFVRDEFECLFGRRNTFSRKDKDTAVGLLNFLSKSIDTPVCLDYLSQTLEDLEVNYPTLF